MTAGYNLRRHRSSRQQTEMFKCLWASHALCRSTALTDFTGDEIDLPIPMDFHWFLFIFMDFHWDSHNSSDFTPDYDPVSVTRSAFSLAFHCFSLIFTEVFTGDYTQSTNMATGKRALVDGWRLTFAVFVSNLWKFQNRVKTNDWSRVEPQFARKLMGSSHCESGFSLIFIDFPRFSH